MMIVRFDLGNRVEVNPNAIHDSDPAVYLAQIVDARWAPRVGDVVTAIQPDEDPQEPDYVSTALVTDVDPLRGLIRLYVDWAGFHEVEHGLVPLPGILAPAAVAGVRDWIVQVGGASAFVANPSSLTSSSALSRTEPVNPHPLLAPTR